MRLISYIAAVLCVGGCVLAQAAGHWHTEDPVRFAVFLSLTLMASVLKIRLPGVNGTYALSFVFVLVAIADFGFAEAVLLAAAGALVQSTVHMKRTPAPIQVLFNVSVLATSAAVSYGIAHAPVAQLAGGEMAVLAYAAFVYWAVNTGLVSIVLALEAKRTLAAVWRNWCIWSFPYYLTGGALAAVLGSVVRDGYWPSALLVLPLVGLTYLCYRVWLDQLARQQGA